MAQIYRIYFYQIIFHLQVILKKHFLSSPSHPSPSPPPKEFRQIKEVHILRDGNIKNLPSMLP